MRTNAPAPAPTYVDFVVAPAGYIGINTFSFGATRGATLRILKIPWMDGTPSRGFFFERAELRRKQVPYIHLKHTYLASPTSAQAKTD